ATEAALLDSPPLLDRDLSWLEFNQRVLHEAEDDRTPLLERVKFLAIFSSNLDEFFMKRVELLAHKLSNPTASAALEPTRAKQRQALREKIIALMTAQATVYAQKIRPGLAKCGIWLLDWHELTDAEQRQATELFRRTIYPILTPLIVDPSHPFPFLSNLSQSLGVLLKDPDSAQTYFARIKVPTHLPHWIRLHEEGPGHDGTTETYRFARLLDIVRANLDALFPGMHVLEVMSFRVTRNAEVESDDDGPQKDLLVQVEEELRH